LKTNPITAVLVPYLICILGIPLCLHLFCGLLFLLTLPFVVLLFHPFWKFLVSRWFHEVQESGMNPDQINELISKYRLDCGGSMELE